MQVMMFNTRDRFKFCTWCGRLSLNIGVSFTLVVWGQQTGAKAGLQIYRAPMGGTSLAGRGASVHMSPLSESNSEAANWWWWWISTEFIAMESRHRYDPEPRGAKKSLSTAEWSNCVFTH